jgi:hypothetical protein
MLETNLDDVSGEIVGHCAAMLWNAGALDVYTTSIQMKKNRPGVTLTSMCDAANISTLEGIIFRETGTLGVRRWSVMRHKLVRDAHQVQTAWGSIDGKVSRLPGEAPMFSPEYEACAKVAQENDVPVREVIEAAQRAYGAA